MDPQTLARIRLSRSLFLRDFLRDDLACAHGIPNTPRDLETCLILGRELCGKILEPLIQTFGPLHVQSGYRSPDVSLLWQMAGGTSVAEDDPHVWDRFAPGGGLRAGATVVIPWLLDQTDNDTPALAVWLRDHLPCDLIIPHPETGTLTLVWSPEPRREIRWPGATGVGKTCPVLNFPPLHLPAPGFRDPMPSV